MKLCKVVILGKIYVLSFIYIYVGVCRFCAVRCLIIICFHLLYSNYSTMFITLFLCLFSILCIQCFCVVLCIVFPFVYSSLFPICVLVYRQLPLGGKPIAVYIYIISLPTPSRTPQLRFAFIYGSFQDFSTSEHKTTMIRLW